MNTIGIRQEQTSHTKRNLRRLLISILYITLNTSYDVVSSRSNDFRWENKLFPKNGALRILSVTLVVTNNAVLGLVAIDYDKTVMI